MKLFLCPYCRTEKSEDNNSCCGEDHCSWVEATHEEIAQSHKEHCKRFNASISRPIFNINDLGSRPEWLQKETFEINSLKALDKELNSNKWNKS